MRQRLPLGSISGAAMRPVIIVDVDDGVTAHAMIRSVSRSVAMCRLKPLNSFVLLLRPCRMSGSWIDTPSFGGDALANAGAATTVRVGFELLRPNLDKGVDMLLQRGFSQGSGQPLSQPRIERIELLDQGIQGPSLGFGVAPFDI